MAPWVSPVNRRAHSAVMWRDSASPAPSHPEGAKPWGIIPVAGLEVLQVAVCMQERLGGSSSCICLPRFPPHCWFM